MSSGLRIPTEYNETGSMWGKGVLLSLLLHVLVFAALEIKGPEQLFPAFPLAAGEGEPAGPEKVFSVQLSGDLKGANHFSAGSEQGGGEIAGQAAAGKASVPAGGDGAVLSVSGPENAKNAFAVGNAFETGKLAGAVASGNTAPESFRENSPGHGNYAKNITASSGTAFPSDSALHRGTGKSIPGSGLPAERQDRKGLRVDSAGSLIQAGTREEDSPAGSFSGHSAYPHIRAKPLSVISPDYPAFAVKSSLEGVVTAEAEIDEKGNVTAVRILKTSRFTVLDSAVVESIKKTVFSPALRNGRPVADRVKVSVDFSLENR